MQKGLPLVVLFVTVALAQPIAAQNLDKIKKLSADQAAVLVKRSGPLSLSSLAVITDDTAQVLFAINGCAFAIRNL